MTSVLFNRTPSLRGTSPEAKRQELLEYFQATFDRYEALFSVLASYEAYYRKPITLRHPLIFYLGHTATFFTNKFLLAGLIEARINGEFEAMFAVGVDEMSWDDLNEAHYDWPGVNEVRDYRAAVREMVTAAIARLPLELPIGWDHPAWAVLMGIEHERIHLETSSVLIRQHRLEYVSPHPAWEPCRESGPAPENAFVDIPAGPIRLGEDRKNPDFYGWDNEFGRHQGQVPEFQTSRYLVSNREFLAFVDAGGYRDNAIWEEEGRAWKQFSKAEFPSFWVKAGDTWRLRLMLEEISMPWNWPVEVNYHEAKAFCNWKAKLTELPIRLPTEDEWHRLYELSGIGMVKPDEAAEANLHLDHGASPCPVDRFRHGELHDVAGNVWQWTETPIYPFEGFAVHPLYDDFTTPTFDNRHNLVKGGSWISTGNEALPSARYAFRRHFFQHAGFRYVSAEAPVHIQTSVYETDRLASEYLEFHYGEEYFGVANFSKTLVDLSIAALGGRPTNTALDLGCAVGRASFELARHFDRVTGLDFSARFIAVATQLAEEGQLRYQLTDEGELIFHRQCSLAELGLEESRGKVAFFQGDACNLKPLWRGYDLILAANLIDRLHNPGKFLEEVHERLNIGGVLAIATPCTWLEEHTRREHWIGGFKLNGERYTTLDGLKHLLQPHFRLLGEPRDVPFVIRETRRKFQHSLAETTFWERVS